METSLHRQLKELYAPAGSGDVEVPVDGFRIDAVANGQLIEIQHASLASIRDKIAKLLSHHRVVVVKPMIARKELIHQNKKHGSVTARRLSPKRETVLDVFGELVHFTRVFPHRNLTLEVPLVEIEEWRYPGHGRRRRWRANDFQVEDQRLVQITSVHRFETVDDLRSLMPASLPRQFHTGILAEHLGVPRWFAQQIAYCYRKMSAVKEVGKLGNARIYEFANTPPAKSPAGRRKRRAAG